MDVISVAETVLPKTALTYNKLSVLTLPRSHRGQPFAVGLVFLDGETRPSFVLKVARDTTTGQMLESEHNTLTRLHQVGSPMLIAGIPQPVHCETSQGLTAAVQSAHSGRRMKNFPPDAYFSSSGFMDDFKRVTTWLGEFHKIGPPAIELDPYDWRQDMESYRQRFSSSVGVRELLDRTAKFLESSKSKWRLWHGDFCTANVLVDDQHHLGVIDWEQPLTCASPVADLLHFMMSIWCIPYRKGSAAVYENMEALFFTQHPLRERLTKSVRALLSQLDLDEDAFLPLSAISWVMYANRKFELLEQLRRVEPHRASHSVRPLVLIEDRTCQNLELLAGSQRLYLLSD